MSSSSLLWGTLLLIGGVAVIAPELKRVEPLPEAAVAAAALTPAPQPAGDGTARHELVRAPDMHFYAEATVNGAPVRFLIDTGASAVVLTRADAQRAGVRTGAERVTAIGVSGPVEMAPARLDRVAVGPIEARDVEALVGDALPMSLLGQSWLSRLGAVEIRGDRMVLR